MGIPPALKSCIDRTNNAIPAFASTVIAEILGEKTSRKVDLDSVGFVTDDQRLHFNKGHYVCPDIYIHTAFVRPEKRARGMTFGSLGFEVYESCSLFFRAWMARKDSHHASQYGLFGLSATSKAKSLGTNSKAKSMYYWSERKEDQVFYLTGDKLEPKFNFPTWGKKDDFSGGYLLLPNGQIRLSSIQDKVNVENGHLKLINIDEQETHEILEGEAIWFEFNSPLEIINAYSKAIQARLLMRSEQFSSVFID